VYSEIVEKGVNLWLFCEVVMWKFGERNGVTLVPPVIYSDSEPRKDLAFTRMSQSTTLKDKDTTYRYGKLDLDRVLEISHAD
jgi:hypothetical protein